MSDDPSTSHKPQPTQPGQPTLRPHVYDGIQEFDQKLPNWWLFTLYITIVLTLIYWVWHFQIQMPNKTYIDDYQASAKLVEAEKAKEKTAVAASTLDNAEFWKRAGDPAVVERGKAVFGMICYSCHAPDLTSKIGPAQLPGVSLVDAEWLYGNKPGDLVRQITNGSQDIEKKIKEGKPVMQAKGGLPSLTPDQINDVVVYILSYNKQGPDTTIVPKG